MFRNKAYLEQIIKAPQILFLNGHGRPRTAFFIT
jgi:hypothetical protein